jgi:hypothetical protein
VSHPEASQQWSKLRLASERQYAPALGSSVLSRVETVWLRDDPVVYRRSDDWYDTQGSKALYQERSLTWRGLVGLRWVERELAPIYHDVFADEGWFGESTLEVRVESMDELFPVKPSSRFVATTTRRIDKRPAQRSTGSDEQRRTTCVASAPTPASEVHLSLAGQAVPVACEIQSRDIAWSFAAISHSRLAYLPQLGIYLPIERRVQEPKTPFDADDAPPRWSSTMIRYVEVEISP